MNATEPAHISFDKKSQTLQCEGNWTLSGISSFIKTSFQLPKTITTIDGSQISNMDTAGAWALYEKIHAFEKSGKKIQLSGFSEEYEALFRLVNSVLEKSKPIPPREKHSWVYRLGEKTVKQYFSLLSVISFLGETVVSFGKIIKNPIQMQWKSFLNTIDQTGYRALPIVGLLCFLIGVVLAYQMGQQLKTYGANIYIVSLLGIGVLQEFGPLITAIIVAGRTSSAFTAEIGTMQINEEIDALRTMGLSPVIRLVVPKILGLIIALPLLVIWADIFGVLGGMIVANRMLEINYYSFLLNFPLMVKLSTLMNGLIKAPVFAIIIAGVGCFQGFRVISTADSIGRQTTKSVVQSIFLIIVADAIFSIILPWQSV